MTVAQVLNTIGMSGDVDNGKKKPLHQQDRAYPLKSNFSWLSLNTRLQPVRGKT